MKHFLLIIFLILQFSSYSQNKPNDNEIVAEGYATLKIKPDMAQITINVRKSESVESEAISNLNSEVRKITNTLEKLGFTKTNIRIGDYSISENHDGSGKYYAQNSLKLNFRLNNNLIDNFYQQVQSDKYSNVSIYLTTYLSDELKKETEADLLREAIKNAKANAVEIADALNVKIGTVKYASKSGYPDREDAYNPKLNEIRVGALSTGSTSFSNYDVEEKQLNEQITVVFNIDAK